MTKYNKKTTPVVQPTTTLQGGSGFTQTPEKELIGLLSTGLTNTYYERETEREKRFSDVFYQVASKNPTFAAKALIYARTVFGQRTVTHYGAVQIIKHLQGNPLGRKFFSKRERNKNSGGIVYRLDDMHEILACYLAKNGADAPIPNSIKKGFKEAIEAADAYQLAKYQMKGKAVSLVDIVNLVHPKETPTNGTIDLSKEEYLNAVKGTKFEKTGYLTKCIDQNNGIVRIPALHALVIGVLKQFNTVEDKNSEAGQEVAAKVKAGAITKSDAEKELAEAKKENYSELIKSGKIGYLALLRNLRNILTLKDSNLLEDACRLLTNAEFIRKSLVLPHQIDLALEVMLTEFGGQVLSRVAFALNEAYEKSVPNLADYFNEGRTAVVLDVSGSMSAKTRIETGKISNSSARAKGALIAATLAKGIAADLYVFADSCASVSYNPLDSVHSISKGLSTSAFGVGGGTRWSSIFPALENKGRYDRIFLISDEQGADSVEKSYNSYVRRFGYPETYVINMCGYEPTMIKESSHVHRIYGYGADVYETAKRCEIDYNALIKEINKIVI